MRSSDRPTRTNRPHCRQRTGFTLIEMLVVVIIIAILAGMVMGLSKIGNAWEKKSGTNDKLGRLRAAIEEFRNQYGTYPPVPVYGNGQPFGYEYATTNMNPLLTLNLGFIAQDPNPWGQGPIYTFGLMSFLVSRARDLPSFPHNWHHLLTEAQWRDHNASIADQPRDTRARIKWNDFIESPSPLYSVGDKGRSVHCGATSYAYTNRYLSVYDAWGSELNYQSDPPYAQYRLWSNGPDRASGTSDDLETGAGF